MGPGRASILVLDDDGEMGAWLVDLLTDEGYLAEACQQGPAALAALAQRHPDLLIADMVLDGMPGLEVLCQAKQQDPALAVVMITAFGSIASAVEAMRLGAFSYLTKPFKSADLLLLVERALEDKHLRTEIRRLQHEVEAHYHFDRIIGKSPAMQRVFALVERVRDGSDSGVRGLPCAYLHEPGIRGVRGLYLPANAGITSSISCRVWSITSASLVPVGRRMNFETPAAM
jgi:DNA-binding NtrC family response regulator